MISVKCKFCIKEFKTIKSYLKRGQGKFCSRECYAIWQSKFKKGKNNPHWRGGMPKCFICKIKISFYSKFCAKHSPKIRESKMGDKNPMWKGDEVGLNALHGWIKNRLKKLKFCQSCKKFPPYDLANISQKYKRDLSDWEWLCRKCHMLKDGRLEKLKKGLKNKV